MGEKIDLTGGDQQISEAPCTLLGFHVRETTHRGPVEVLLSDGTTDDDRLLHTVHARAGEKVEVNLGRAGEHVGQGLVATVIAYGGGAIEGWVEIGPSRAVEPWETPALFEARRAHQEVVTAREVAAATAEVLA